MARPGPPLEQVIADRLIQLSRQDRTVDRLVKDVMADTSELLGNLADRRTTLWASRKRVQDQIDRPGGGHREPTNSPEVGQ